MSKLNENLNKYSKNLQSLERYKQELELIDKEISDAKFYMNQNSLLEHQYDLLCSLKRNYSGVYGRFVDLCHPIHKKFINLFLHNFKIFNCCYKSNF